MKTKNIPEKPIIDKSKVFCLLDDARSCLTQLIKEFEKSVNKTTFDQQIQKQLR